ncbi:chalcone isomerase family protein [Pseudomonas turukhanskensis]|uniref:Chalcone isomerase domain-containing protein n=1 Tax=Pseudomonas turukhanskensis TaxID=1806536 RepID=A0A9W6K4P0_9PSED|nr:chalcone isomerase family protein [Pseudomonas turukhanskensis]GLK89460.1 hypothetical protein GCM10017655_25220 [Pseudomonas turukhanskensis]
MSTAMRLTFALLFLLSSHALWASEPLQQAAFPAERDHLQLKTQTVLTYLWVDLYAAAFYTDAGVSPRDAVGQMRDQRLELYYLRAIDRNDVIKAAWATLERQQPPEKLHALRAEIEPMEANFKDIQPGDRYALNYSAEGGLVLELNGKQVYRNHNAEFARAYLGLWLARDGLSDDLREQLLATE